MSRPLDADRLGVLGQVAAAAVLGSAFPGLQPTSEHNVTNRAFLALIAADELGLSLIDALNRVRFTDQGLSFAPAVDATFEDVLRQNVTATQKAEKKARPPQEAPATISSLTNAETDETIPKGFTPEGKRLVDCTVGELAYFIDEAQKKGAHLQTRTTAWKILSMTIPTASALDLGKLTRWILNPKFPNLRVYFADALVAAEARLEELGETRTQ